MAKIIEKITSLSNQKIKNIVKLQKSSERRSRQLFVCEGEREIKRALLSGYKVHSSFFCSEIIEISRIQKEYSDLLNFDIFEISFDVFKKISYREDSGGVSVLFFARHLSVDDIILQANPLILVLDSLEKPGNIGAVLRTADSAGVDAVFLTGESIDLYNPNIIRASLGCVFALQIVEVSDKVAVSFLQNNGIIIYTTHLNSGAIVYSEADFKKSSAIVMGTEATGISDFWLKSADTNIVIPMCGIADSMNVSASAAVLIYEAFRQRGFQKKLR